jgi:hypothetical protein
LKLKNILRSSKGRNISGLILTNRINLLSFFVDINHLRVFKKIDTEIETFLIINRFKNLTDEILKEFTVNSEMD